MKHFFRNYLKIHTGLPGTGKKSVCYQYAEEFMKTKDGKKRIVSTWNLETPESLFR